MTRLVESDIEKVAEEIIRYDEIFREQTGSSMEEIARRAAGVSGKIRRRKTAVIPVTSGLGVIGGFARSVGAILNHCGIETVVTDKTDVAGLKLAYEESCELAFLADDEVCGAFGIGSRAFSDNGDATGRGYAQALLAAVQKRGIQPKGCQVLVIGAGPVGRAAAGCIVQNGGIPVICDLDTVKASQLVKSVETAECMPSETVLRDYRYILDASTSGDFIGVEDVTKDSIIAAPGMPWGVTKTAMEIATVICNPLELGIITMYFDCIRQMEG